MHVRDEDGFSQHFQNRTLENSEFFSPEAAQFGTWESVFEEGHSHAWDEVELRPFDWIRHCGFRHSSTHGPHVGRGLPLRGTSWMNRPYHVDWFLGTFFGDELIDGRVDQDNVLLSGIRLGWDFDYYWGLEWRFGWSDPSVEYGADESTSSNGSIFITDISVVYYPWGDSRVRPYGLWGLGFARYEFVNDLESNDIYTLVSMPIGGGVQFQHTKWLVWRIEALDNIAFGADGMSSQHSASLTIGMELRVGSQPQSYWPWKSKPAVW